MSKSAESKVWVRAAISRAIQQWQQFEAGRTMFILSGLTAIIVLALYWWFRPPATVIENGNRYTLLPFSSQTTEVGGKPVDVYLIPFIYKADSKHPDQSRRATILVPKAWIRQDLSLPENVIVWDPPIIIEGQPYAGARWNPKRFRANGSASNIKQEAPPRR